MDKQHMLSLQPPLAKAYLYGRGMFRLLPSPAFFLLGQCLGLALLEGALAGMDPCISKKALFLAVSIAPLLATLGLSRWGPPPLAHLPTRLHYFAAPFLSYGAAGVAIHQWGWGAPAIPECSMENFPPTEIGKLQEVLAHASTHLHTLTAAGPLFVVTLLGLAMAFALPHAFQRSSWISMGCGVANALRWMASAPAKAGASLARKAADHAITPEEMARMERSAIGSDCEEGSDSKPHLRL